MGIAGCERDSTNDSSNNGGVDSSDDSDSERGITTVFSPALIGSVELKNRLIRSATEEAYCQNGLPSPPFTKLLTDLAAGGVGAIISGIAMVAEEETMPFELHAFSDEHVKGFAEVREAVRKADPDCRLFAQIGHQGYRYFPADSEGKRIGPSDVGWPGDLYPTRALELAEIEHVVDLFAQSIRRFKEGGWDGVEIHGGHGYLISSFLSPFTNKRTDKYGGSVPGRVQIVSDIIERARDYVGDNFPIFIKFNSDDRGGTEPEDLTGGITQEIFVETAKELSKMRIDAIDVSGMHCSQFGVNDLEEQSYFKSAAVAVDIDIPIILTGGNRNMTALNEILSTGEIQFFGISRPLIREPNLVNKWLNGETTGTECISCNQCAKMENLIQGLMCHQLG